MKWLLVLLLFVFQVGFSQSSKKALRFFEKAKNAYISGEYTMAANFAERALESDSMYFDSHLLLADIFQNLDSLESE
ncbi:MAG: hypothetical protein HQ541_21625, partial [Mariniphaga sp.]|nr:hypothetical protein [Mariniphaga sp.]